MTPIGRSDGAAIGPRSSGQRLGDPQVVALSHEIEHLVCSQQRHQTGHPSARLFMLLHQLQGTDDEISSVLWTHDPDGLHLHEVGQWLGQPNFVAPRSSLEAHGSQADVLPAPSHIDRTARIDENAELGRERCAGDTDEGIDDPRDQRARISHFGGINPGRGARQHVATCVRRCVGESDAGRHEISHQARV